MQWRRGSVGIGLALGTSFGDGPWRETGGRWDSPQLISPGPRRGGAGSLYLVGGPPRGRVWVADDLAVWSDGSGGCGVPPAGNCRGGAEQDLSVFGGVDFSGLYYPHVDTSSLLERSSGRGTVMVGVLGAGGPSPSSLPFPFGSRSWGRSQTGCGWVTFTPLASPPASSWMRFPGWMNKTNRDQPGSPWGSPDGIPEDHVSFGGSFRSPLRPPPGELREDRWPSGNGNSRSSSAVKPDIGEHRGAG